MKRCLLGVVLIGVLLMAGCVFVPEPLPDPFEPSVYLLTQPTTILEPLINGEPLSDYKGLVTLGICFVDFRKGNGTGIQDVRYTIHYDGVTIRLDAKDRDDTVYIPYGIAPNTFYWFPACTSVFHHGYEYVPLPYSIGAPYLRQCNGYPPMSAFLPDGGMPKTIAHIDVTAVPSSLLVEFVLPAIPVTDSYRSGIEFEPPILPNGDEPVVWRHTITHPGAYTFQPCDLMGEPYGDPVALEVPAHWFEVSASFEIEVSGVRDMAGDL